MKTKTISIFVFLIILGAAEIHSQWQQTNLPTTYNVRCLAVSGTKIYAGAEDIFSTTDFGTNWINISTISPQCMVIKDNYIFAGTYGSGLYISSNLGINWSQANIPAANNLTAVAYNSSVIFAGTGFGNNAHLQRSTNNGKTWSNCFSSGFTGYYSVLANDSVILCGGRWGNIYRSINNGLNWIQISSGVGSYYIFNIVQNGSIFFAATADVSTGNAGIFVSSNNGYNWSQTSMGNLNSYSVVAFGTNVIAGTDSSVYFSSNNGVSWVQHNEGMGNRAVLSLIIVEDYVYAGAYQGSVWKRPLSELVGINNVTTETPEQFSLSQNYPNPFNPTTNIKFSLPVSGYTTLNVYDAGGKLISTMVNSDLKAGIYKVDFNGAGLASGIYFYRLTSKGYFKTMKMILIK
jgi:hypothetical protein